MPLVLDTSIAACWAFADEDHPVADLALDRATSEEVVVPLLWWFELRNVLIVNERRGRITKSETAIFLKRLERLSIALDPLPEETALFVMARKHGLTAYDACYLELAKRRNFALATLDKALLRGAAAENVDLLGARNKLS